MWGFSGQYVNHDKSNFYTTTYFAGFNRKNLKILNCNQGSLPLNYLAVPILFSIPKARFLQPLVDKVKLKLASWKGKSLSMMERIQLVNIVVNGVLSYIFNIYR